LVRDDTISMENKTRIVLLLLIIGSLSACLFKPPIVLQYGGVLQSQYKDTVSVEIRNRLILVPVQINGKDYTFLFDTGAPFSISDEIQEEFGFKVISKGNIVDSDGNRQKVNYVNVKNVKISEIDFLDQTAFVGNFKANPVLKCFGIDGIVGSNLIRHADWLINMPKKELIVGHDLDSLFVGLNHQMPFTTDMQYNILLQLPVGSDLFKDVKIDYGSNGGLDLHRQQFSEIESHHLIESSHQIVGGRQTGLLGEVVQSKRRISISDSISFGGLEIPSVEIQIGNNDLIGTQALKKAIVGIDWKQKKVHFSPSAHFENEFRTHGFYSGISADGQPMIRAVFENSLAFDAGLKEGMLINEANGLDFENGSDFCDYIDLLNQEGDSLSLELQIDSINSMQVVLPYKKLD